jgi:general secretion pathway protein L
MASPLTLARTSVSQALGWWLGELAGMVPQRLRRGARRDRPRLVLAIDADAAALLEPAGEGERLLAETSLDQPGHEERLREALRRLRRRRRPAAVRLAPALGLRRLVELPLAAEHDLDQLLRFEMDRLTPFRPEEVMFAHRVVRRDTERKRLVVELQVAPRAMAAPALELAERIGARPVRLELAASGDDGGAALNLLPREPAGRQPGSRINRILALLAVALAVAAVVIPLQQQRSTAGELERQVAALRGDAEESLRLRERLATLSESARFLAQQKLVRPPAGEILAELTRLVPDQAYVVQLDMRDGAVNLHGFAATASELIAVLEQSPLFRTPQFRSPVTRDAGTDLERFHISVELAGVRG